MQRVPNSAHSFDLRRPASARRQARLLGPVLASSALLLGALTGCAASPGAGSPTGTEPGASASSGASEGAASAAGSGAGALEIPEDGVCAEGDDVSISEHGAEVVLSGPCGTVSISGSGVHANIESAESVEITGKGASLLGDAWGAVRVSAEGATLNVTEIEEFSTSAAGTTLINQRVGVARIDGHGAMLNGVDADRAVLNGDGATVMLTGTLGALEVHGDENTVSWVDGTAAAETDAGSGNVLSCQG